VGGNVVKIEHADGYSTRYLHNNVLLVNGGDKVDRRQKIALSGSTGWSTNPHVHYEVWRNGTPVDPTPSILLGGVSVKYKSTILQDFDYGYNDVG
jgi:murein DD-endopeptidase MepM/ murein hydrolase activator NlpD